MSEQKPIQIFSNLNENIGVNVVKSPVKLTILEMLRDSEMEFEEIVTNTGKSKSNALIKKLMESLYKHLDESTDLVTTSVELKMNKENGTWTVDEGSLNDFVGAVYGVGELFGPNVSD